MQSAQKLTHQGHRISFPATKLLTSEQWLVGAHIITAFVALSLGIFLGPFQVFRRAPMLKLPIPFFSYYYEALTVHGVVNALVFTTFFIVGFSYFVVQRSLQREIWRPKLAWGAYWTMLIGMLMTLYAILSGQANVLYTFYPSMLAHPLFYLGLTLVIVGTWIVTAILFMTYYAWRRESGPSERVPLAVFATLTNYTMWCVATLGVAIEVLFMLLPLSLGFVSTTDPQTARALFWFFGHPLVYFWLIPAYISWYTMLPKQTNSKLFSDPLARVAFILLLIFSIPVGVHHMYVDPGVSQVMKVVQWIFTFAVAIPSFLTIFNIGAVLERAGRLRGATGRIDWMWKQDWWNPIVAAQLVGMLMFVVGGISGIVNASLTLNIALHNTSWIPAHFHTTLGGAVTMTFIGIAYWLIPMVTGKQLYSNKMALVQIYTSFVGMLSFGFTYSQAGLLGVPRRTDLGSAPYINAEAVPYLNASVIGGVLLLISSILLFANLLLSIFASNTAYAEAPPIDTKVESESPMFLERWGFWLVVVIVLCIVAWGPVFLETVDFASTFNAPVYRPEVPMPIK